MNRSVPTSTQAEFVNVSPLNTMISKCEIKVLYTGLNRNKSFITKEIANKMAQSLPGTPIVGEFLSEDFGDHGEDSLVIDDHGIRFVKSTVPYGFIPTDAKIWWQNFMDCDGVEREYLLTEGYLWTGRYPETKRIVEKGNGQSMELDRDSLIGEWTKSENAEFEYFNINEAFFSALCILGEDVEPCFEGANINKPQMLYSLDKDDFKSQLNNFMLDLKDALSIEGGSTVDNENKKLNPEGTEPEENKEPVNPEQTEPENGDDADFAKKKKEDEDNKDNEDKSSDDNSDNKDDNKDDSKKDDNTEDDDEDKKKKKAKYNLEDVAEYVELSKDFLALQTQFNQLKAEHDALKPIVEKYQAEQDARDLAEKEEMIKQFYMLDEEDLKDVKENITNFTLEQIESKLCVIAVRKKVNFNLDNSDKSDRELEKPVTTFNVDNVKNDSTPAWLKAVENRSKK